MTDSILSKYTNRPTTEPDDPQLETEDIGSFGWLRGMRERTTMLELRKKDGNITAIGYAWIEKIEFDPSHGITLHALGASHQDPRTKPQCRSPTGREAIPRSDETSSTLGAGEG